MEQFGELVPMMQILDAPVPQLVDKLEDVLKIVDLPVPEQKIDVPKISSFSRPPLRRALPVPQLTEQLVDVPVPETVAAGAIWYHVAARRGWRYWWMGGIRHVQWRRREGFTDSPGRYFNTGQG